MLKTMDEIGISGQTYASLQDFHPFKPSERNYGMVTQSGAVKKPVYYALKLLDMLKGKRIKTSTDSPTVEAIATNDNNETYILLWNFISSPAEEVIGHFHSLGYDMKKVKELGLSKEEITDFIKSGAPINKKLPQKNMDDLMTARQKYIHAEKTLKTKQIISFDPGKVYNGPMQYKRYVLNSSLGKNIVNNAKALDKYRQQEAIEKVEDKTIKNTDRVSIEVDPESIHLIIISKK
jgi:hypothetical protein